MKISNELITRKPNQVYLKNYYLVEYKKEKQNNNYISIVKFNEYESNDLTNERNKKFLKCIDELVNGDTIIVLPPIKTLNGQENYPMPQIFEEIKNKYSKKNITYCFRKL